MDRLAKKERKKGRRRQEKGRACMSNISYQVFLGLFLVQTRLISISDTVMLQKVTFEGIQSLGTKSKDGFKMNK